jgi:hypothetical protein
VAKIRGSGSSSNLRLFLASSRLAFLVVRFWRAPRYGGIQGCPYPAVRRSVSKSGPADWARWVCGRLT